MMQKLCCFLCKEDDLPSIDVNITCPSTCCVENKISRALSRKFSNYGHGVGNEAGSVVLQRASSGGVQLNREIEQSKWSQQEESENVVEKTGRIHTASTS